MCRIFGFRSRISLAVHHSLVDAENALSVQSRAHPDGWGLGYYEGDEARVIKAVNPAFADDGFALITRLLSCQALVAHVRKATVGDLRLENTHPFRYGRWLFAHNGDIEGFQHLRPFFLEEMDPRFRELMKGSTDSEHCFYLFLTELDRLDSLESAHGALVAEALAETLRRIHHWSVILGTEPPILNFLATDGRVMGATRLGRSLYFSTQKKRCSDYDFCPSAAKPCLGLRIEEGPVTHLSVASEPTSREDIWEEMPDNSVLLVDQEMIMHRMEAVVTGLGPRDRTREKSIPAAAAMAIL